MELNTSSSFSSSVWRSIKRSDLSLRNCSGLRAISRSSFFIFFKEWVMIYARFPSMLNRRLLALPSPASEQKMNSLQSKSCRIFDSKGFKVVCSFLFPGKISKARGIPSASINNPIVTIGFGRCSLLFP